MPQPESAPVPPEVEGPSSVVTGSSTTLEDSAAGAAGVSAGEIAATENGGGHSPHKLGNNTNNNNADAAAGGAGNNAYKEEENESSIMTSSLILEQGTMPLKAAEQRHDEDGKQEDSSLPSPNSPQSHGGNNNDASSTSTLDSTEVRTAFRLSAAEAFSSERAMNSTAVDGGSGSGTLPRRGSNRSASERSLGSHGSVRGAGWDDPAFDHTGTTPDDEHLEEMIGNEEEEEDEAKRKGNKLSQALLRMGSSTVTELGSNRSSKARSNKTRSNSDDGHHGRVARFVPPATQTSTSNLMANSGGGGGGRASGAAAPKRNSNESQVSSDGGGFRYHNRAYRRASNDMTHFDAGMMATTSTGMSESRHHYIDPYDPLPAGAQVGLPRQRRQQLAPVATQAIPTPSTTFPRRPATTMTPLLRWVCPTPTTRPMTSRTTKTRNARISTPSSAESTDPWPGPSWPSWRCSGPAWPSSLF